jgi:hypothetical protein
VSAGGGGGAPVIISFGASQVPVGTRAAAAALPTVVVRTVGPNGGGAGGITGEGRGVEGTGGCRGSHARARGLRVAVSVVSHWGLQRSHHLGPELWRVASCLNGTASL